MCVTNRRFQVGHVSTCNYERVILLTRVVRLKYENCKLSLDSRYFNTFNFCPYDIGMAMGVKLYRYRNLSIPGKRHLLHKLLHAPKKSDFPLIICQLSSSFRA